MELNHPSEQAPLVAQFHSFVCHAIAGDSAPSSPRVSGARASGQQEVVWFLSPLNHPAASCGTLCRWGVWDGHEWICRRLILNCFLLLLPPEEEEMLERWLYWILLALNWLSTLLDSFFSFLSHNLLWLDIYLKIAAPIINHCLDISFSAVTQNKVMPFPPPRHFLQTCNGNKKKYAWLSSNCILSVVSCGQRAIAIFQTSVDFVFPHDNCKFSGLGENETFYPHRLCMFCWTVRV